MALPERAIEKRGLTSKRFEAIQLKKRKISGFGRHLYAVLKTQRALWSIPGTLSSLNKANTPLCFPDSFRRIGL